MLRNTQLQHAKRWSPAWKFLSPCSYKNESKINFFRHYHVDINMTFQLKLAIFLVTQPFLIL